VNCPIGESPIAGALKGGEMKKINVLTTMDARVWAKEFMRIFGRKKETIDEELMVGWFANAIMKGYDCGCDSTTKQK
jgi:hypothetical protein